MQGVKGVEEFFLSRFFTGDELDIIDQQDIDVAIAFSERLGIMAANGIDQIIGEFF